MYLDVSMFPTVLENLSDMLPSLQIPLTGTNGLTGRREEGGGRREENLTDLTGLTQLSEAQSAF